MTRPTSFALGTFAGLTSLNFGCVFQSSSWFTLGRNSLPLTRRCPALPLAVGLPAAVWFGQVAVQWQLLPRTPGRASPDLV
jgi:hypothetical protein